MTIKNKVALIFLLSLLALSFYASTAKADTTITDGAFVLAFTTGDVFVFQDLLNGINVTFTVSSGNLTGMGTLTTNSAGGTLIIYPTCTGILNVTSSNGNYTLKLNNAQLVGNMVSYAVNPFTISWVYPTASPTAAPYYPEVLNVKPFWQYIMVGDLMGFFQAIFLWSFLQLDILVGVILSLFLIPLYLKTRSLNLLCIIWILLGSFFIVAAPALSGLAIIFLVLGIGSVFWKLVHPN